VVASRVSGTSQGVRLDGLPFALKWLGAPLAEAIDGGTLSITSGPRTDWFVDPAGTETSVNAPALLGRPEGDFTLCACVEVDFEQTYDAGVLALWHDGTTWAKLCFEYSPQGHPMVVSVVTRGVSDDCNSIVVSGKSVWLRIAHIGRAYAFHASTDGAFWQFVRYFAFEEGTSLSTGFEAQSPLGEGCTARFTDLHFSRATLTELRDGS
jgi:regulation of enolase protein 1 (concanavalin A-like superfamily)